MEDFICGVLAGILLTASTGYYYCERDDEK